MARSWGQLLGDSDAPAESEVEQRGFFGRLRESLGKSRRALTEQLAVAAFDPGDDASWERLEEALIYADVGVRATAELIRRLEARQELGVPGIVVAFEPDREQRHAIRRRTAVRELTQADLLHRPAPS